MQLNLKYLFSLLLLLVCCQLNAQLQFEITVSAKEIGKRDEIQVEYVISGANKVSNFKLPYFKKWSVINGPTSTSILYDDNGRKSTAQKYTYLLSPTTTGKLELPGTTVKADGKEISCKSLVVTVLKQEHVDAAAAVPSYAPAPVDLDVDEGGLTEDFKEYELKPGEDPMKKISNNLFVKAFPSKQKCYVGEPVLVTYKLYTRLKSTSRVQKQPTFSGCSVNEMTTVEIRPVVETYNGKKYNTYVFRRVQLFPLQPGMVTTTAATVDNTITFVASGGDLRQRYYGGSAATDYDVALSTTPFNIEVLPLPGNKITSVGNFEIFAKLKKDTIAANETNALIVTVVGSGNFRSVAEPAITWPANLYHFDTKESDEIDKLSFPLTGRRTYEIPFEANAEGAADFSPVALSFFDPSKSAYRTVKSTPLHLTITPAIKTNIQQTAVEIKGDNPIRYLLYLLPIAFILGGLIIWQKPKKKTTPQPANNQPVVEEAPPAPATFNVQERFDELVLIQDDTAFYSEARRLAKELVAMGIGNEEYLLAVLQDCNTMLYTPMPASSRKEIIEKLQKAIH